MVRVMSALVSWIVVISVANCVKIVCLIDAQMPSHYGDGWCYGDLVVPAGHVLL